MLLDLNTPAPLRYWLLGHQVETAHERGWAELTNGELLRVAQDAGFDAVVTFVTNRISPGAGSHSW